MSRENQNTQNVQQGLYVDSPLSEQIRGTHRFALNTVRELKSTKFSNESSNEIIEYLPVGYTPIGKCYMTENEVALFLVGNEGNINVSEIGILDLKSNKYVTYVNDRDSLEKDKLNFTLNSQINIIYRLRRGCEKTIYFAGKGYPVRYFNFNKLEDFKKNNLWVSSKFRLFKKIDKIPEIDNLSVLDSGGNLKPGSYSIYMQYLDADFNSTEHFEIVENINIYNDSVKNKYSSIRGSMFIEDKDNPYGYSKTSKAISVTLENIDKNFSYIRFSFIERTSGNGQVSRVTQSELLSIENPSFIYTGDNSSTLTSIEDISLFNLNSGIETAQHLEQIDNMLILSNIQSENLNLCALQSFASRINVDCVVKDIILSSVKDKHNSKNPLVNQNGLSFQAGEVYSLGIEYIFDDYTSSPICHLVGKSSEVDNYFVYSPGGNVYPMSNIKNKSNSLYTDNNSCNNNSFWGKDSQGLTLENTPIRHHRFPTRDSVGLDFIKKTKITGDNVKFKKVVISRLGELKSKDSTTGLPLEDFETIIRFDVNGVQQEIKDSTYIGAFTIPILESSLYEEVDNITNIKIFNKNKSSTTEQEILLTNNTSEEQSNGLTYKVQISTLSKNDGEYLYKTPIFGIKLSNVELPSKEEIGKKIIGYRVVKQERTEVDKTIVDSGVIFPMTKSGRNVSTALLAPEYFRDSSFNPTYCEGATDAKIPTCFNISKRNFMLLSPNHKFLDKSPDGFTSIKQIGIYERDYVARTAFSIQNVYDGTSAQGEEDDETKDTDGFSLRQGVRFSGVNFKNDTVKEILNSEDTSLFNLEAINYADTTDGEETLYNLSSDNKALIVSSTKPNVNVTTYGPNKWQFPYVYIEKDINTFYQNFRSKPYFSTDNILHTGSTAIVFGGDTHIAPLRYSNHVFGNVATALRRQELSTWQLVTSVLVVLVGVALSIFAGPLGIGAIGLLGGILTALGGIATGAATIIKTDKFNEIYAEKWKDNLDKSVFDFLYARLFIREHPHEPLGDSYEPDPYYLSWQDDTFRWFGDVVGDMWFETQLNISLRVPPKELVNNFLNPLEPFMGDNTQQVLIVSQAEYVSNSSWFTGGRFHRYVDLEIGPTNAFEWYFYRKVMKQDKSRATGEIYTGISTPQIYLVNPDYHVTSKIRKKYMLPLEYNCCSDCKENFPHRVFYSSQSFQEENSDNYRMILPNNYVDLDGSTGEITNMFKIQNNLFVQTREALWKMGRNYQERVTGDVISFIGTGSYFEIPPQRIVENNTGASAGTQHNWGYLQTPIGSFFVSENENKIYIFNGEHLKDISKLGLNTWFKNNMKVHLDSEYYKKKGKQYPYKNNPSNPIGTGFISTYDYLNNRVLLTKKDFTVKDFYLQDNIDFVEYAGDIIVFEDMQNTISNMLLNNWSYAGIEKGRLKFYKKKYTTLPVYQQMTVWHPPVYEDIVDTSIVWVDSICTTVTCPGGNYGCYFSIDVEDADGISHSYSTTHNDNTSQTECLGVNTYVKVPVNVNINASQYTEPEINIDPTKVKIIKRLIQEGYWEVKDVLIPTSEYTMEYTYIDGIKTSTSDLIEENRGWTLSFSLESYTWISWHSYIPNFYIHTPECFYSWEKDVYKEINKNPIWKHSNLKGEYQTFYGKQYPHIIEYVSNSEKNKTKQWNYITFQTESSSYNDNLEEFVEEPSITFNKAVLYNTRQCSGELVLKPKNINANTTSVDYLWEQVVNNNSNEIIVSKREKDWNINDFRDIRVDYNTPIWNSNISSLQAGYYIDKTLNTPTLDVNKDWTQLESFRDKYLVVRLIFDKFADKKLITNFSVENEQQSFH